MPDAAHALRSSRPGPIPSRHYPPGQRLDHLLAFDAAGREVASQTMPADQRGLYPCAEPKDYGYGFRMCP
jgi:hypothetical protein